MPAPVEGTCWRAVVVRGREASDVVDVVEVDEAVRGFWLRGKEDEVVGARERKPAGMAMWLDLPEDILMVCLFEARILLVFCFSGVRDIEFRWS